MAWLGLGGNLGDPARAMATALQSLDAMSEVQVEDVSPLYRTPPWGVTDQPDFINAVAGIRTTLGPRDLLARCLETERSLKRVRAERWGPRVIDIDILIFGNVEIDEDGLRIPHPRMLERGFVLAPLAEIAPDLEIEGLAVTDHLARIDLSGIVKSSNDGNWWRNGNKS